MEANHSRRGRRYLKGLLHALTLYVYIVANIYMLHMFFAFPDNIGNGSKEITLLNHHVGAKDPRTKDMKT